MLHTPATLRTVQVPQVASDDDPYQLLVAAIVARAVADAQGETFAPGSQSPDQIEFEARTWLRDEAKVTDLLELADYEAAVVLSRIRRLLQESVPVVTMPQLTLF